MSNIITSTADFNGVELTIIHKDGQRWLTAEQVGIALQLNFPRIAAAKIYRRHKDEFEQGVDVAETKLVTATGAKDALIFSSTGCMLLAMFARSRRAKEFRRWAKHVLAGAAADHDALVRELLAARPLWRQILSLKGMMNDRGEHLPNKTIAAALGIHKDTLRKHLRRMEALGIIPRPENYERYRAMAAHLPTITRRNHQH